MVAGATWAVLSQPSGAPPQIPAGVPRGVTPAGDPYLGAPQAPVTIEEYGDFQCPFCGEFARDTEPRVVSTYVVPGKARLVWHTMAFIGPESVRAGEAALCAQDQGKFWDYYMLLYTHQGAENSGAFAPPRLVELARRAHLDAGAFRSCLEGRRHLRAVQASDRSAARRGVTSTPTFFINGREAEGALSFREIARIVDTALAERR